MDEKQLVQYAAVQMLQAEFASGSEREVLMHDVQDALLKAETVSKGSGAFMMACVHGRNGNEVMCQKWLVRAQKSGRLPERVEIEKSTHLRPFFEATWFRDWLEALDG